MENEILIENKLSENMSNRVVVIHEDGQLDVVASLKDKGTQYHIKYFQAYLEQRYLDDQTLQTYAKTATEPSTIIYLLLKNKGDIVFTETTSDTEENKYGILYLPDTISKEQKEKIEMFKNTHLKEFKELLLYGQFYLNEYKMVDCLVCGHIIPPNYDLLDTNLCLKEPKQK